MNNAEAETLGAVHTHTHTHTLCLLKNNEIKKLYIKYKYMRINLKYKLYMVGFLCPPILY